MDDSSEEFEYVKGSDDDGDVASNGRANGDTDKDTSSRMSQQQQSQPQPDSLGTIGEDEVWNVHADQIAVGQSAGDSKGTNQCQGVMSSKVIYIFAWFFRCRWQR